MTRSNQGRGRALAAIAALLALASAKETLAQTSLFRQRAELALERTSGLVRVELPAEIVEATSPGLGDLRVIDASGASLPYVIDGAPPAGEQVTWVELTPAEARQLVEPEAEGTRRYREEYDVELPSSLPPGGTSTLVLRTDNPHFTAEASVERTGADGSVESLTTRTVFRLPGGQERLEITLPAHASGRLHVRLSGEQGFLSPTFGVRSVVARLEPTFLFVDLPIESSEHVDGRTILVVRRPLAVVPTSLEIVTSASTVQRAVRVLDVGADGTQFVVGEGQVTRVAGSAAPSALLLPIDGVRGDRLRVELVDDDSGRLPDLRIAAHIQMPSVVFDGSSVESPVWLYFGGARALAPRFPEAAALLGASTLDRTTQPAPIRTIEANPFYSREPALRFAMRAGPTLDARAYAFDATVTVPESPEGLVRIVIPRTVEAHVDPSRRDLRLVDAEGRQWAYLVGQEPHEEEAPLRVTRTSPRARASRYALSLTAGPQDVRELALRTGAAYLDRPYRLLAAASGPEGEERLLSSGRLRRRPGEPAVLRIPVDARVSGLVLEVVDGDDAPLPLEAAALVRLPVLYVAAPEGPYRLLFGVPAAAQDIPPPSYELEAVRDLVLTLPAVDAAVGAVRENAAFAPPSAYSASRLRDIALWAVLGIAVLTLGALTFRLARSAPPPGDRTEERGSETSGTDES